jgi:hypothetical protein
MFPKMSVPFSLSFFLSFFPLASDSFLQVLGLCDAEVHELLTSMVMCNKRPHGLSSVKSSISEAGSNVRHRSFWRLWFSRFSDRWLPQRFLGCLMTLRCKTLMNHQSILNL